MNEVCISLDYKKNILSHCKEKQRKRQNCNTKVTLEELKSYATNNSDQEMKYLSAIYYNDFENAVHELIKDSILKPIKSSEKIGALFNGYIIIGKARNRSKVDNYLSVLYSYHPLNLDYYRNKVEEFEKDKIVIDKIFEYYKKREKKKFTPNELGFYLFQDEKAFEQLEKEDKTIGQMLNILQHMKLDLFLDLNVKMTVDPFSSYTKKSFYLKQIRNILILENKDTYYRLKEHTITKDYDMIIYGEGNNIESSFSTAQEYGIGTDDNIYYFGDIDLTGFAIYKRFKEKYQQYRIELEMEFYRLLLEHYTIETMKKIRKNQSRDYMIALEVINQEFQSPYKETLENIIQGNYYIPQEAIGPIIV